MKIWAQSSIGIEIRGEKGSERGVEKVTLQLMKVSSCEMLTNKGNSRVEN